MRFLGAPVTDAQGKSAARSAERGAWLVARTSDVICSSVGYRSTSNSEATSTLPSSAIRPRSFLSMSTIIRFSARCFSELARESAAASSCSAVGPRGAVPFIGRAASAPFASRRKKSSGEAEAIAKRPRSTKAACRGRCAATSRANSAAGSSTSDARMGNVRFTW